MIDRFKLLLEQLHLSPSEFADKIGVQRSSLSHVLSGRNKPSIDFIEKILNVFPDTDTAWLITGRITSQKDVINVNSDSVNDKIQLQNVPVMNEGIKKTPEPDGEEPVEQIIIVYQNNTFRMLKPLEK